MSKCFYILLMDTTGKTVVNEEVKPRYHAYNVFMKVDDGGERTYFGLDFEGDESVEMQRDLSCNRSVIVPVSDDVYDRATRLRRRFSMLEKKPQFPIYLTGNLELDQSRETNGKRPVDIFGNISEDTTEAEMQEFEWTGRQRARANCVTFSRFVQETTGVDLTAIDEGLVSVNRAKAMNEIIINVLSDCFNRNAKGVAPVSADFCLHETKQGAYYMLSDNPTDDVRSFSGWKDRLFEAAEAIPQTAENELEFSKDPKAYPQIIMDALNARRRVQGFRELAA